MSTLRTLIVLTCAATSLGVVRTSLTLNASGHAEDQDGDAAILGQARHHLQDEQRLIDALTRIARQPAEKVGSNPRSSKAEAIWLLGHLHAEESVPALCQEVEYRVGERADELTAWGGMPAVQALMEIGFPSVKYILRPEVLQDASPERLRRFAVVVRYVFPDAKTARAFVEAYDATYATQAKTKRDELLKLLAGTEADFLRLRTPAPMSQATSQSSSAPASQPSSAPTGPQP